MLSSFYWFRFQTTPAYCSIRHMPHFERLSVDILKWRFLPSLHHRYGICSSPRSSECTLPLLVRSHFFAAEYRFYWWFHIPRIHTSHLSETPDDNISSVSLCMTSLTGLVKFEFNKPKCSSDFEGNELSDEGDDS